MCSTRACFEGGLLSRYSLFLFAIADAYAEGRGWDGLDEASAATNTLSQKGDGTNTQSKRDGGHYLLETTDIPSRTWFGWRFHLQRAVAISLILVAPHALPLPCAKRLQHTHRVNLAK
jgi:hypothetical protein